MPGAAEIVAIVPVLLEFGASATPIPGAAAAVKSTVSYQPYTGITQTSALAAEPGATVMEPSSALPESVKSVPSVVSPATGASSSPGTETTVWPEDSGIGP